MKDIFRQSKFRYTNEAVGLFVLVALLIFIAGLIYSGRVREWFNPGEMLRVVLPDEGLSGLAKGSSVEILGTKAGEVRNIVINPNEKMHADVRIDSEMAVFVRSDSKATIRKTFGIAGDAYLEITRGSGKPLDWEFAVINAVSDRKPTDTVGELIDEMRTKILPIIDDAQKAIQAFSAIAQRIERGEGTFGRLLTEDKLVRDLENLVAQLDSETRRVGPILDALQTMIQNLAEFSTQFDAQTGDVPEITRRLKEAMASVEKVTADLSQTTPQLPEIVKNVGETADTLPVLVLQVQQVMVELERFIKQLQDSWLLGGSPRDDSQAAGRLSPLEVRP